jgi:ankyrin repeat protein
VETVRMLAEMGNSVNARAVDGCTPLHWAAGGRHIETVRLMVEMGSRVIIAAQDGFTPLQCAEGSGREAVVRFLRMTAKDKRAKSTTAPVADLGAQTAAEVAAAGTATLLIADGGAKLGAIVAFQAGQLQQGTEASELEK